GRLRPGESRILRWRVDSPDPTTNELEIWHGFEACAVCIESPTAETSDWIRLGETREIRRGSRLLARIYHRKDDPQNHSHHVDAFVYPGAPEGEWRVTLRDDRTTGEAQEFHA